MTEMHNSHLAQENYTAEWQQCDIQKPHLLLLFL